MNDAFARGLAPAAALLLGLGALTTSRPAHASSGILVPTFGGDGLVVTDFAGGTDNGRRVAIQADGRIVVGGFDSTAQDFTLARYNTNGSLDTSFDTDGKVSTDFGGNEQVHAMALQTDGKIVVAGLSNAAGDFDFAVARYNTNGSLDTTFDTDGRVTTDLNGNATDMAFALAIQTDGNIVVGGFSGDNFALVRYNTNGSRDNGFDTDGIVLTEFGGNDQVLAIAIQTDTRIVAAGFSSGTATDVAVARYNSNGGLDTTFDTDGRVTTDFSGGSDQGRAIAIQTDAKIVVAGLTAGDFGLIRYNTNGSLDGSFDGDGRVITDFLGGANDQANDMLLQGDGKLVVAGISNAAGHSDFAVARYRADGSLDTEFSADGWMIVDFGGMSSDQAYGIALDANGFFMVTGLTNTSGQFDFGVARIAADLIFADGFE